MSLPVYPVARPDAGVERQVLSHSPELMVVSFRFQAGATGALHSHPHVQSTYVARGRFRFFREQISIFLSRCQKRLQDKNDRQAPIDQSIPTLVGGINRK